MDNQETTGNTNSKTLRLTITIDIDRDTVPSFGTVRRDGQIGAWNIAENLEEMGMTVKSIDVNARSVIETETED